MKKALLKCGCVSSAYTSDGEPFCIVHDCFDVAEYNLELIKKRTAKCEYCKKKVESNLDLPFFEYKPEYDFDSYYCGCRGWD